MNQELIISILTVSSLAGLLLAVGLRLTFEQVSNSVLGCQFVPILALNFLAVPLCFAAVSQLAGLSTQSTVAMVILGAAPFAPVVPVFARMARADLALAAGLTSIYPVISAFLTPWICELLLEHGKETAGLRFASGHVMLVLVATTTLPLALGVLLNHRWPNASAKWLRIVEVISEATGACSLGFVVFSERQSILAMTWKAILVTALIFELCVLAGYALAKQKGSRRVVALGTSNRNIALALLVAIQSFPALHVVSAVAGHGLLLIAFGLVHVGYWRLRDGYTPRDG